MSLTKELSDVLMSAQTATSLSGLSMLLRNSAGELAVAALSNAVLKSVLTDAVVNRGVISDLNAVNPTGFYNVDRNTTQNLPTGMLYGKILILNHDNSIVQFIFDWTHNSMTVRMSSSTNHSNWYTLTLSQ